MKTPSLNLVDPDRDPNRYNSNVHYRLYDSERHGPTVVCVQDFDYADYDGTRFLTYQSFSSEAEAEERLFLLLTLMASLVDRARRAEVIA